MKKLRNKNSRAQTVRLIFFHPDYTVGFGISPNHALSRSRAVTAGGESNPAPKIFNCHFFVKYQIDYSLSSALCKEILSDFYIMDFGIQKLLFIKKSNACIDKNLKKIVFFIQSATNNLEKTS